MTSTPRFWIIAGVLASLVLAALGWNFLISPRMEAVAQTRTEAEELNTQTERTMFQVRQLKEQAQDLPAQIRTLKRMQRRIPSSVDVPALLREVQRSAKEEGVVIETLTPGQITVFTTTEQDSSGSSSSSSSSDEPRAAPDSTPAPKPSPEATRSRPGFPTRRRRPVLCADHDHGQRRLRLRGRLHRPDRRSAAGVPHHGRPDGAWR